MAGVFDREEKALVQSAVHGIARAACLRDYGSFKYCVAISPIGIDRELWTSERSETLGNAQVGRLGLRGGRERAAVEPQRFFVIAHEPAFVASEQKGSFMLNKVGETHQAHQRVAHAALHLHPRRDVVS